MPLSSGTAADATTALSGESGLLTGLEVGSTAYGGSGSTAGYVYRAGANEYYFAYGDDAQSIMQAYEDALAQQVGVSSPYTGSDGHGSTIEADGTEGADALDAAGTGSDSAASATTALADDGLIATGSVETAAGALPIAAGGVLWMDYQAIASGHDWLSDLLGITVPPVTMCSGACATGTPPDGYELVAPHRLLRPSGNLPDGGACTPGTYYGGSAGGPSFPDVDGNGAYCTTTWTVLAISNADSQIAFQLTDVPQTAYGSYAQASCSTGDVPGFNGARMLVTWTFLQTGSCAAGAPFTISLAGRSLTATKHQHSTGTGSDVAITPQACSGSACEGQSLNDAQAAPVPATAVPGFTTQPAYAPLTIPTPTPNELWTDYDDELLTDGFTNVQEDVLTTPDPLYGPNQVTAVSPSPGNRVAPNAALDVDVNPADAPVPAAGVGPFTPPAVASLNFPHVATPCNVFPFGVPCWLYDFLSGLYVTGHAPSFTIHTTIGGGQSTLVDLSNLAGVNGNLVLLALRPFLLILMTVGLVLFVTRFVGRNTGGDDGGGGDDDGGYI